MDARILSDYGNSLLLVCIMAGMDRNYQGILKLIVEDRRRWPHLLDSLL